MTAAGGGTEDAAAGVREGGPAELRFGVFRFVPSSGTLFRDGRRVALRPQQAKALDLLLRRAGEVVSREDLRDHLWGSETYLDVDAGLNTCVRRLRSALGDEAGEPRFVQTVPGSGYRFIAPVSPVAPAAQGDAGLVPATGTRRGGGRRRPAVWTLLGLAGLLAAAVPASMLLPARRQPEGQRPVAVVLLADFDNRSGEELLDDSLEGAFRIGLSQSRVFELMTPRQVQGALRRMERAPTTPVDRELGLDVCQRQGAVALVAAGITKLGGRYLLHAEVVEPETGRATFASSREAPGHDDLLPAIGALVAEVRGALGESLSGVEARGEGLEQVTTSDLRALKDYSRAVEVRTTDAAGAVVLLERALERDPDFAMAHAILAVLKRNRGDLDGARRHLSAALRHGDRLTELERLYTTGHAAMAELDVDLALETWSLVRRLYPGKLIGYFNEACALDAYRGDYPACVAVLDSRPVLRDNDWEWAAAYRRAGCLLAAGRLEEALSAARSLYTGDSGPGARLVVDALLALGRGDEAGRVVDELEAVPSTSRRRRYGAALARAAVLAADGRFAPAAEAARRARERSLEVGSSARVAAWTARLVYLQAAGEETVARGELRAAGELLLGHGETPGLVDDLRQPTPALALLGVLAARSGEVELAEEIRSLLHAEGSGPTPALWGPHVALLDAEVLAARGDLAAAEAELARALERAVVSPLHAEAALARWQEGSGRGSAAAARWRRLAMEPGRAMAECLGGDACLDHPFNLVAHREARRRTVAPPAPSSAPSAR